MTSPGPGDDAPDHDEPRRPGDDPDRSLRPEPASGRRTGRVAGRVAVAIFAVVVLGTVAGVLVASRSSASTDHVYDIPLGTRQRIEAGEDVEIVPAEMHVRTGDSLTITNDDDVEHEVGLFTIRPGERLAYTFPNPGVFRGACTVHPSGGLTIYVE